MKTLFYTVAMDQKNFYLTQSMINSFKKFNTHEIKVFNARDMIRFADIPFTDYHEHFFRVTPFFTRKLIDEYDCVIRLDADQIITGNLDHVIEGDYDAAVVQNSNPRDWKKHYNMTGQMLSLYDIDPLDYVNCGFIAIKSKRFVEHWWKLCNAIFFERYPFREQDMLNILVHHFNYKIKFLDRSNKWHGLISKGYWAHIKKQEDTLIMPKNDEWPKDEDKEIMAIHWAGGDQAELKLKDLNIKFQYDVAQYLKTLML